MWLWWRRQLDSSGYEAGSLKLRCCFNALGQSSVGGESRPDRPDRGAPPSALHAWRGLAAGAGRSTTGVRSLQVTASCQLPEEHPAIGGRECFADNFLSAANPSRSLSVMRFAAASRSFLDFSISRIAEPPKHRDGHAHHTTHHAPHATHHTPRFCPLPSRQQNRASKAADASHHTPW